MNVWVTTVLLLAVLVVYCGITEGATCGGSPGVAAQSACTRSVSSRHRKSRLKYKGWGKFTIQYYYTTQYRTEKYCNSGYTLVGGDTCKATATWSAWSTWGACSGTCGTGRQTRRRTCTAGTCSGSNTDTRTCQHSNACPAITCGASKYADAGSTSYTLNIVGGDRARPNEFPWQVALKYISNNLEHFLCGGTIINSSAILTAAHCMDGRAASVLRIYAGDHNIAEPDSTQQLRYAASIRMHPNYRSTSLARNDVAVIRLTQALSFSADLQPACLPAASLNVIGSEAIISGWGRTVTDGNVSNILRFAKMRIVTAALCNQYYGSTRNDVFCVSDTFNNIVRSPCYGDSGGPMVVNVNSKWTIVGVTSYGSSRGCAEGHPTGFRNVMHHLDFINL